MIKFNPVKIKKTMDYLPQWAWYLGAFLLLGPIGLLGVYLVNHVLERMIDEREQDAFDDSQEYTVSDDEKADEEEDSDADSVIREGRAALGRIRRANDLIHDAQLSSQIDSIKHSCSQIFCILEQRPELVPQLRTFLRYYLPTTLRLLDARAKLEHAANTPKAREVRTRISNALGVIDKAFLKQVEGLDEYRFIDLESEMDVLRDMLRADGLIDEDETQPKNPPVPFSF